MKKMTELVANISRAIPYVRGAHFIYSFLPRAGGETTVRMRLGHQMIVDPSANTELLPYFEGRYDDEEVAMLTSLLDPDEAVLDIGGNIGFYAIPLARAAAAKQGTLFVFEPLPANYARLRRNLELNGLLGVARTFQTGASDRSGSAMIRLLEGVPGDASTGNAAIVADQGADDCTTTISLVRLDDVLNLPRQSIGVCKLDVEGHEVEALRGARDLLVQQRPLMFVEYNRAFYTTRELDLREQLPHLLPPEYTIFRVIPIRRGFLTSRFDLSLIQVDDLSTCGQIENVLLVPSEKLPRLDRLTRSRRLDLHGKPQS